ncbi:Nucleotide exchange factor SIL1 [[Candida] zeylanoides]
MKSIFALVIAAVCAETICSPSDPTDCYPRIFEPTEQWQVIREGQDIPAGLHVRLNMESQTREAKLLAEEGAEDSALVAVGEAGDEAVAADEEEIMEAIARFKGQQQSASRRRSSPGDLRQFDAALEEVKSGGDPVRLAEALDTLESLSHDIEFGEQLTRDHAAVARLVAAEASLVDSAYRVVAAALRNNPVAVANVLAQPTDVVAQVFARLADARSDVDQKRVLGVIGALAQSPQFAAQYFAAGQPGVVQMVRQFSRLGPQSQARAMNILEDVAGSSFQRQALEGSASPQRRFSELAQHQLVHGLAGNADELLFTQLTQLHRDNDQLRPTPQFLQWLAKEAQTRSDREKRDGTEGLGRLMLEARHQVFGNPMAQRKAVADEL